MYDYLFKTVLLGDYGSGKSCLLSQFTDKNFKTEHDITIGVEFGARLMKVGDIRIKIHIWDTAGQESFRSITRSYYRGSTIIFLVYDISRVNTFLNIPIWLKEIRKEVHSETVLVLIGNKIDKENVRQVSTKQGEDMAAEYDLLFFETSAKTGSNVDSMFEEAVNQIVKKIKDMDKSKIHALGIKKSTDGILLSRDDGTITYLRNCITNCNI